MVHFEILPIKVLNVKSAEAQHKLKIDWNNPPFTGVGDQICLAWALIGEWTSRVLFPVPKGPWPRHGHAGALLQNYKCRSPRIVAWARAAFEQGALPSLLMMPVSHRSSVSREIVCSRPRKLREASRDLLLFMPMEEPRQVWKDLLPRLHLKGGFLWRLQCSAPRINRLCGQGSIAVACSSWGCLLVGPSG